MIAKVIADLLTGRGGFVADGDRLCAPEEGEATVFAGIGNETLVIDRVKTVELDQDVAILTTRKEVYVVACNDVRALRFTSKGNGPGLVAAT